MKNKLNTKGKTECTCYSYRDAQNILHLIQCDKCARGGRAMASKQSKNHIPDVTKMVGKTE